MPAETRITKVLHAPKFFTESQSWKSAGSLILKHSCYWEVTWHSSCYETCRSTGMESPRHWRDHLRDKAIYSVEHRGKKITHCYRQGNSNYTNITSLTFFQAFTAGWLFIYDAFHISSVFNDFSLTLLLASSCLWLKKGKEYVRVFFTSTQKILLKQQLPVDRHASYPLLLLQSSWQFLLK